MRLPFWFVRITWKRWPPESLMMSCAPGWGRSRRRMALVPGGPVREVEASPDGARRWVVEACHSWLNRNRASLIRWSKKEESHLALLMLASGLIAFKEAPDAALQAASEAA